MTLIGYVLTELATASTYFVALTVTVVFDAEVEDGG